MIVFHFTKIRWYFRNDNTSLHIINRISANLCELHTSVTNVSAISLNGIRTKDANYKVARHNRELDRNGS